jgi:putative redox protein
MFEVTFPGGLAVDATVGNHTIHTDQPAVVGGGDTAPAPFELFLASLATCAGFYALRFCQERGIATEGLGVSLTTERDAANPKRIGAIHINVKTPPAFPEKYREAMVRAVDHCAVKRAIIDRPEFEVTVAPSVSEGSGARVVH